MPEGQVPALEQTVDLRELKRTTLTEWAVGLLLAAWMRPTPLRLTRRFLPIVHFRDLVVVTRYDDVSEVLTRDDVFAVLEERVAMLNEPTSFLLGMQRGLKYGGVDYARHQELVMSCFRRQDIAAHVTQPSAKHARAIVDGHGGRRLNAARDLVTTIAIKICRDYYGVPIPADTASEVVLAEWLFLISRWMFDPGKTSRLETSAKDAIRCFNGLLDRAIAMQKAPGAPGRDTILKRLVDAQVASRSTGQPLEDHHLRAALGGMILGFVPTNTMAGVHMLDVLLDRPEAMQAARAAAREGDDVKLQRCLFEAHRFQPLLREPMRICTRDDYVLAEDQRHQTRVPRNARVWPLVRSAMLDETRVTDPLRFDPDRPAHHSMLFGLGLHRCIGAAIAEAQLTQTLKPLLLTSSLRRARGKQGKIERLGAFPVRLQVELGP